MTVTTKARSRHIGIASWSEDGWGPKPVPVRLVITVELQPMQRPEDFQTVEHEPTPADALAVSVTHEFFRRDRSRSSGSWLLSCGASTPDIPADATWDAGWNAERYTVLQQMAERWHLNGLNAGCVHQTVVWEDAPYRRPSLTLTEPCPVTGYKYGHAWLTDPLTPEARAYFEGLIAG